MATSYVQFSTYPIHINQPSYGFSNEMINPMFSLSFFNLTVFTLLSSLSFFSSFEPTIKFTSLTPFDHSYISSFKLSCEDKIFLLSECPSHLNTSIDILFPLSCLSNSHSSLSSILSWSIFHETFSIDNNVPFIFLFLSSHNMKYSQCTIRYIPVNERISRTRSTSNISISPAPILDFMNHEISFQSPLSPHNPLSSLHILVSPTPSPILPSSSSISHSFLETDSSVQILSLMMKPVMGGTLKPVVKTTIKWICNDMMPTLISKMTTDISFEVPHDEAVLMLPVLAANLSNVLTDTLSQAVSTVLSESLSETVTPHVSASLLERLPSPISSVLYEVLRRRIPLYLRDSLPHNLWRLLNIQSFYTLSYTLSHSLIPTLTHTLTHSVHSNYHCYLCYSSQKPQTSVSCHYCHFSQYNQYYISYYSAYFTDYYQKYYSNYYGQALIKLDKSIHHESSHELSSQKSPSF